MPVVQNRLSVPTPEVDSRTRLNSPRRSNPHTKNFLTTPHNVRLVKNRYYSPWWRAKGLDHVLRSFNFDLSSGNAIRTLFEEMRKSTML